ncbi:hypothetical protein [Telmatospirillum sp.]|uniref:hypothetical protein n=1 Tax=Telmatospirillum sp. TaxID=2079197 RepID=UPI002848C80F|nr:hypothetical protein [Telmatospirillum sp.]MDR3436453.1 hypothetical protein [Telmatospirillum sp.]
MISNPFLRYLRNVFVAVDDLGSALTLGDGQETISSRLGKAEESGHEGLSRPLRVAVNWVALHVFGQENHCESSIEEDRGSEAESV